MTNSKDDESFKKIKEARLRLEGGGKLSDVEHDVIDKLNAKIALALYDVRPTVSLAQQSLGEMLLSACANSANTPEELMKNAYTFMKDFWFVQAEKFKEILIERMNESRKESPEQILNKLRKRLGEELQPGMVLSGSPEEIVEKLNQLINPVDDCDCPKCVERRKREAEASKTEPKSPTKH